MALSWRKLAFFIFNNYDFNQYFSQESFINQFVFTAVIYLNNFNFVNMLFQCY